MKPDTPDHRYERIAALVRERDKREEKLEEVETELRTLIYRLDSTPIGVWEQTGTVNR